MSAISEFEKIDCEDTVVCLSEDLKYVVVVIVVTVVVVVIVVTVVVVVVVKDVTFA
jgi:hypothetical protein